jgi:hypothetical protein
LDCDLSHLPSYYFQDKSFYFGIDDLAQDFFDLSSKINVAFQTVSIAFL